MLLGRSIPDGRRVRAHRFLPLRPEIHPRARRPARLEVPRPGRPQGTYELRVDNDFEAVIRACADRRDTWIGAEIIRSFVRFHELGKAHSVEAYRGGELAGGLYGVALGGAFMGESMFSRMPDASKVCLVHLVERLKSRGYVLLDCQIQNDHLARLGAVEIPEREFLRRLEHALSLDRSFV